jgi:hypothetical protein
MIGVHRIHVGPHHARIRSRIQTSKLQAELARKPDVVGVEEGDELTLRTAEALVSCRRDSTIRLPRILDPRVSRVSEVHQLLGAVRGAVVNDEHFYRFVVLREDTVNGERQ